MRQMIIGLIELGGFDLADMIQKINYYHVSGQLTDSEREELIQRAQEAVIEGFDVDPKIEILALWEAVHKLQEDVNALKNGEHPTPDPEPDDPYPPFVQPTGVHDAYSKGQGCTFNGKHYESLIDANVWAPDVYPQGWMEVD